jgi:hypothetical protein
MLRLLYRLTEEWHLLSRANQVPGAPTCPRSFKTTWLAEHPISEDRGSLLSLTHYSN